MPVPLMDTGLQELRQGPCGAHMTHSLHWTIPANGESLPLAESPTVSRPVQKVVLRLLTRYKLVYSSRERMISGWR